MKDNFGHYDFHFVFEGASGKTHRVLMMSGLLTIDDVIYEDDPTGEDPTYDLVIELMRIKDLPDLTNPAKKTYKRK